MIAVDTNILVYAHRRDSDWHKKAALVVRQFCESQAPWIIPSHALVEFYSIVTHPRIYNPPSTPLQARKQIESWLAAPSLILAHSSREGILETFSKAVDLKVQGPQIHDIRLAADCDFSGAQVIYSADRDFSRILSPKIVNPLIS